MEARRITIALSVCLSWMLAPSLHATNRAVVVGIHQYADNAVSDPQFCVRNAKAVYRHLVSNCGYDPDDVLLMHTEVNLDKFHLVPTRDNLHKRVQLWLGRCGHDDTLLFFFSGHGFLHDGQAVLATFDSDSGDILNSGLKVAELRKLLEDPSICKAQQRVMILDTAHASLSRNRLVSQSLSDGWGEQRIYPRDFENSPRTDGDQTVTIHSCLPGERSYSWMSNEIGYFTFYLTQGLRGAADRNSDKIIDHIELFDYTSQMVGINVSLNESSSQTPVMFHSARVANAIPLAEIAQDTEIAEVQLGSTAASSHARWIQLDPTATAALTRLKDTRDDPDIADIDALATEAKRLRSDARGGSRLADCPLLNPFRNVETASLVAEWLSLARQRALEHELEFPLDAKVSLALAYWYGQSANQKKAADVMAELKEYYPFDEHAATKPLQTQLMLIHAHFHTAHVALDDYGRILDQLDDYQLRSGVVVRPDFVNQFVLEPARELVEQLVASENSQSRSQSSRFYLSYARLVLDHRLSYEYNNALSALEFALRFSTESPQRMNLLASIYMAQGDWAAAREWAKRAMAATDTVKSVERARALQVLADCCRWEARQEGRVGSSDEQRTKCEEALDLYEQAIEQYRGMGESLQSSERLALARAHASRAAALVERLDARPESERERLWERARTDAASATETDPQAGCEAWLKLGRIREQQAMAAAEHSPEATRLWNLALDCYVAASAATPLQAEPWICRGALYFNRGPSTDGNLEYLDHAEKELRYSLLLDPDPDAHYWLGQTAQARRRWDEADRLFRLAVDLAEKTPAASAGNPRQAVILHAWAHNLLAKVERLTSAEEVYDVSQLLADVRYRARKLQPHDEEVALDILAKTFHAQVRASIAMGKPANQVKAESRVAMNFYRVQIDRGTVPEKLLPTFLVELSETILRPASGLWQDDLRKSSPVSSSSLQRAIQIANTDGEKAQAFAMQSRLHLRRADMEPAKWKSHYLASIRSLETATNTAPEHDRVWRWAQELGVLCTHIASDAAKRRDTSNLQKLVIQGCDYFKLSLERLPAELQSSHRREIIRQWRKLYAMKL